VAKEQPQNKPTRKIVNNGTVLIPNKVLKYSQENIWDENNEIKAEVEKEKTPEESLMN